MTIGLLVPDRPPTPCDGRGQQYRRPGDPQKQATRAWGNGTTLTFGPEDVIDDFQPGDAFYEQILVIEMAEAEIRAVRERSGIMDHSMTYGTFSKSAYGSKPAFSRASSSITSNSLAGTQMGRPNYGFGARNRSVTRATPTQQSFDSVQQNNYQYFPSQASGLRTASAFQSSNRFNSSGPNRPGFSTDTHDGSGLLISNLRQAGVGMSDRTLEIKPVDYFSHFRYQQEAPRGFGAHRYGSTSHSSTSRGRVGAARPRNLEYPLMLLMPPPPRQYRRGTTKRQIDLSECLRWIKIQKDLVVVPRLPEDGPGLPWKYYLIDPSSPTGHPDIIDLPGPRSRWGSLLDQNINEPDPNRFWTRQQDGGTNAGRGRGGGRPAMRHTRQASDQTSVFFNEDNNQRSPNLDDPQYVGYSIGGEIRKLSHEPSASPIPQSRGRFRSAAMGALFNTESRQSSPGTGIFGPPLYRGSTSSERLSSVPIRPSSAGCPSHID